MPQSKVCKLMIEENNFKMRKAAIVLNEKGCNIQTQRVLLFVCLHSFVCILFCFISFQFKTVMTFQDWRWRFLSLCNVVYYIAYHFFAVLKNQIHEAKVIFLCRCNTSAWLLAQWSFHLQSLSTLVWHQIMVRSLY